MTRLRAFDATPFRPADVDEDAVVSVFRVPPEVAGQRLDVFVQSQLHRTSRTRAQSIVRASAYDASGRRLKRTTSTQTVAYQLFSNAALSTPIPVGAATGITSSSAAAIQLPIYGSVQLPGNLPAGTYQDQVVVTLQW